MNRPREFRLTIGDVVAIQRDGTLPTDLDIADWMERSQPHGEYRCSAGAFVVRLCADCLLEYQLILETPDPLAELDRKPAPRSTPQEARR